MNVERTTRSVKRHMGEGVIEVKATSVATRAWAVTAGTSGSSTALSRSSRTTTTV